MWKYFHLKQAGTNPRTEILAGITTFFTMSYIIFVNPSILGAAGMPSSSVLVATCLASALGTAIMAFSANYPYGLAPGMGLNAFFAYTLVQAQGYTWQQGLAVVFISGLIFLMLTYTGLRELIAKALPKCIKIGIPAGIGLFIALIGLNNTGLMRVNQGPILDIIFSSQTLEANSLAAAVSQAPAQVLELGNFTLPSVWLSVIGLFVLIALTAWKIRGAILLTILITTLLSLLTGVSSLPDSLSFDQISLAPTFFKLDIGGLLTISGENASFWGALFNVCMIVISFTIVDLLDTMGTLLGTAAKGNMLDKLGNLPRMKQAMSADAWATTLGSLLGTSTVTAYLESGTGIVQGGRTGLTALTISVLFLLSIFLAPLAAIIPAAATGPALIMVGFSMMESIKQIDFAYPEEWIPAISVIIFMPFTYSIANGIAIGIILYTFIKVVRKKAKTVHPIIYLLTALFILRYIAIN